MGRAKLVKPDLIVVYEQLRLFWQEFGDVVKLDRLTQVDRVRNSV